MNEMKSKLLKISGDLIRDCPISTFVEDWGLPKNVSNRQKDLIQGRLNRLDFWLKTVAIKIRCLADDVQDNKEEKEYALVNK